MTKKPFWYFFGKILGRFFLYNWSVLASSGLGVSTIGFLVKNYVFPLNNNPGGHPGTQFMTKNLTRKAFEGSGRFWKVLEGVGKILERFWTVLEGFRRFWKTVEGSGRF